MELGVPQRGRRRRRGGGLVDDAQCLARRRLAVDRRLDEREQGLPDHLRPLQACRRHRDGAVDEPRLRDPLRQVLRRGEVLATRRPPLGDGGDVVEREVARHELVVHVTSLTGDATGESLEDGNHQFNR
jgi:hypothetical protein